MNGQQDKPFPLSGAGTVPRMGHKQDSVGGALVEEPRTVEEAEAILQQMARAMTSKSPNFAPAARVSDHTKVDAVARLPARPKTGPVPPLRDWDEKIFRRLVELTPDALVIIDHTGTIVLVNSQTEKLFGYRREELLGEPIELLVPERFRDTHVADRDRFIAQPSTRPMGSGRELSGRRKNGIEFPVEISLSPLVTEGGVLVTASVRDITDRKRLEARYRTLVEGIPAVTFMAALDEGNNEFYISPQIEVMLGFTQEEWLGDPFLWHRQLHPDDRQRWGDEFARTCSSGVNFRSEYRFLSRDGRVIWVHGEARVVRDDLGRPLFLQGIAFDITESKRAEAALRESAEELERKVFERTSDLAEATLRAELASRARASFLANMSHEIRTPLNGIIGFADLLRRGADSDQAERLEWLDIIHSSGKHLLALINDILDLSKIDAGKLSVEMVACSPGEIINEVCSILRSKTEEKGLRLETAFDGPMPRVIQSDPTRFRQVLMNVAGNAIKFTPSGHVRIASRLSRPAVGPRKLVVEISDTGIGIPADKLETIFDPFTQADSSITRQFGGTGLGLAISRRLAAQLGGGITVESEVGRGTTFTCEFAVGSLEGVSLDHSPRTPAPSAPAVSKALPSLRNHRVLVVDDGDTNRKLIRLVLGRAGAEVEQAENGQQAVERALAESFDVILMDMQMPVMDGYAATRKLRSRGLTIPIIALTANAMKGDDLKCLEAGCSGYLSKPIDQDLLLTTVSRVLDGERNPESAPTASVAKAGTTTGSPSVTALSDKIVSTLPTDDDEFREIVEQFISRLREKTAQMHAALSAGDLRELSGLAHWLKGTSGTVGFPNFIEVARQMEHLARAGRTDGFRELIAQVEQMAERIVID
jgi:PAS domain S-box-containing protein